jgi:sigma-E factor negative regulatory protein RseA
MVMSEDISRLVDGELDDEAAARVCAAMRDDAALATWACYHLIGDQLRGLRPQSDAFSARLAKRLSAEPTVLAPSAATRAGRPVVAWAWAAAAGVAAVAVVGWTALTLADSPPAVVAKAREAAGVRADALRPATVPQDYVIVHQEYSPATALQGVQPYLRAVTAPAAGDLP